MKRWEQLALTISLVGLLSVVITTSIWAQAGGQASVGLGHGEEGYLHLEEMVKHFEFSLNMPDASPGLKQHGGAALQHAREALRHYNEALIHASESLGRPLRSRMDGSSGHQEGSGGGGMYDRGPVNPPMDEGSR